MTKVRDLTGILAAGIGTTAFVVTSVLVIATTINDSWKENRLWYRNMSKAKVAMSIQDGQPGQSVEDQRDFCVRAGISPCHINYQGRMDLRKVDPVALKRAVDSYEQ
ncbi:hypothetical protein CMO91_03880 [Candidatus Woesearchaeota archaeon]|nr:hypothetical protein [Candidatus Woesearchaeota archaeon]|tara:strand:- start:199 stop:519 length:321 start_codon:yes stop_codon:yes gene_type:complete